MADSKITALTAISTVDPTADPLVIVDVSDTSMAASGTTKKSTINQLLGSGGTATLASATITGDLTVDTSTLKVDSVNNRVGINTTSPIDALHVVGSARLGSTNFIGIGADASGSYVESTVGTHVLRFNTTGSERYRLDSTGVATWSNVGGVAGTAMTLNSTGLGVGVSPAFKLSAAGVSQFYAESDGIYASGNSSPDLYTIGVNYYNAAGTEGVKVSARPSWKIEHKNSSDALAYLDIGYRAASAAASAFTSRFKIDGSGNVGIGVTPSAKLDVQTSAGRFKVQNYGGASVKVSSSGALGYEVSVGNGHQFFIDTTQAMTLDASGILVVGNTAAANVGATGGWLAAPNSGNSYELIGHNSGSASGSVYSYFFYNSSQIGSITQNGTTGVLYNITSDYRLKESVQPIANGLARVNALKPSVYKWKADGSNGEGFIAHELAEVVPFAVSGEKDAVNEDGSIKPQGIDMSRVVPILVAAIQELTARVQTLETR